MIGKPRFISRCMTCIYLLFCLVLLTSLLPGIVHAQADDASPPQSAVKLIFIHHSCGENWLADGYGDLGRSLAENNYFVSDTNYGWGRDSIGDRTDIVNWPEWFGNERNEAVLQDLYNENSQNSGYSRTFDDPGGENEIILFKSCFPNSALEGSPDDAPAAGDYQYSVGSAKFIYNQLLDYFSSRPDKLFIAITAPPLSDAAYAANARGFNNWLVHDWLAGYTGNNVAVFDFYNVLTGAEHHHRFIDGHIEHSYTVGADTLHYPSGDEHPSIAGSQKATQEFIPLLNVYYNRWASRRAAGQHEAPHSEDVSEQQQEEEISPEIDEESQHLQPAASGIIDDFDGVTGTWNFYNNEEMNSFIEGGPDSSMAHSGTNSLRMKFHFPEEGWVDCGRDFETTQNWGGSIGISFWLRADRQIDVITLTMISGQTPFESKFTATESSVNEWQPVNLLWSDFSRAAWAEEGGAQTLDASQIASMVFTFESYGGLKEGEMWVDDIVLIPGEEDIQPQPVAEDDQPEQVAEVEQAEDLSAEPGTEDTAQSASRTICPFSSVALPIGTVAAAWLLSKKRTTKMGK